MNPSKYLGVEFIYQESSAPTSLPEVVVTAEMLATLSIELRQQLHNAALQLDTEEIAQVIAQIRTLAPNIADGLDELAKNFQFEQIIQMTEK